MNRSPKDRLDELIHKTGMHFYRPILIAEILHHDRIINRIDFADPNSYRSRQIISQWRETICPRLIGHAPILKGQALLRLFDQALPPSILQELAEANRYGHGVVEAYLYRHLRNRLMKVAEVRALLAAAKPENFDVNCFVGRFEDPRLRRNIRQAYEILGYALFASLAKHLRAAIKLDVDSRSINILRDFGDSAYLLLGIDAAKITASQLGRVDVANAADAGLDMWANFGPAIQVKHITIQSKEEVDEITDRIMADQVVIVCKQAESAVIEAVMSQTDLRDRIRGFVTEVDLIAWCDLCKSEKYRATLGSDLIAELRRQFDLEFPSSDDGRVEAFFRERGYDQGRSAGEWTGPIS